MSEHKKLFVKTYGCQMNVYDTERMVELMAADGYQLTDHAPDADMIIFNTCHIREKASEKLFSDLGRAKSLKEAKPNLKIGVAGCVAQAEGDEIRARMPMVDIVVGPQSYHRLPELSKSSHKVVDTDFPVESKFDLLPARAKGRGPTAFLTVQEGCDKFCAFCVVPYTRGAEVSRPAARILAEARALIAGGAREITLLGQNVNAYHGEGDQGSWGLGQLIRALAEISGIERIRYTTSHPNDMDDDLIAAHKDVEQLMPYLHLPVQSGSDRILKAMNRKHTRDDYFRIVDRIRQARPDILLTSDFIVGFPGETDQDFQDTMDLVRKVEYGASYSFKYSARPGTPAAEKGIISPELADARLQELQALILYQQKVSQESMVGKELYVLYEKPGRQPGQMVGKSDYLQAVHVYDPSARVGDLVKVRVIKSRSNSLSGQKI